MRPDRDTAPLSFSQERLWFLNQLTPGDPTYNLALLTPLQEVSAPILKRGLYDLVRRHESLRTTIALQQGVPLQRIHEPFVPHLAERDLRGLTGDRLRTTWREFSSQETSRPFDLTRGPLFRCCLYRVTETEFALQCVMHHIISDGWSLQILDREIRALYQAYRHFEASPLEPLRIQFGDYAAWQRHAAANQEGDADLDYWHEQLRHAPPLLELPFSGPRPSRATTAGASRYLTVGAATAAKVKDLCDHEKTTPFSFFLAVFKLLIAKYTDRKDLLVGVPFAGRTRPEVAPLVGFFVNTLVLRTRLDREASFRELLRQVREATLAAQAHQTLPFERLVSDFAAFRSLDHNPVFQMVFSLETGIEARAAGGPFEVALAPSVFAVSQVLGEIHDSYAKFDLTLQMVSGAHGLWGVCEYRTDLYGHDSIEDFLRRFLVLAETCVADPDVPLGAIPIAQSREARVAVRSSRECDPWLARVPPAQDGVLEGILLDSDGLPVPPGVTGRLHLLGPSGAPPAPTGVAAVKGQDGRLTCLGPVADQILINGRRVNLSALGLLLGNLASTGSVELRPLRDEVGRDTLLVTVTAEDPQAARREILTCVRGQHPSLAADLRIRLRKPSDGAPGVEEEGVGAEPAPPRAPRSSAEAAVLGLFLRVLEVEEAGPEDNFFDLGGDSFRAMRLVSELRARFGVEVPLMDFFEAPTAADLATFVSELHDPAEDTRPHAADLGEVLDLAPLSYGQEQLWLAVQMSPARAVYNVPFTIPLKRPVEEEPLRRALREVLRRHAVLRSTFTLHEDGLVQIPNEVAEPEFEVEDLSRLPVPQRWDAARAAFEAQATRPFDLENGPVVRACLFRYAPDDHALMITLHHIVCDGRSAEILREELTSLYDTFEAGLPSALPDPPGQYAEYCVAQRQRFNAARRTMLLRYWDRVLADAPAVLDLPFAKERPTVRSNRGQVLEFGLPDGVSAAVRQLAAAEAATEAMVLLTCFKVLIYRYTCVSPVVVGNAVTDRRSEELQLLVGYFANTVPLCTQLDGDLTFREALRRVRRTQLDAYDHQDLPFEVLVEERSAQRTAAYHPIFQIMFAFQPEWSQRSTTPVFGERWFGDRIVEATGTGTAKFDLTLATTNHGGRLVGAVEYATDLFDRSAMERLIRQYCTLAASGMAAPDQPIGDLSYFTHRRPCRHRR